MCVCVTFPHAAAERLGRSHVGTCGTRFGAAAAAQKGGTALTIAGFKGHAECLRLLLDAGADKNAKDPKVRVGGGMIGR